MNKTKLAIALGTLLTTAPFGAHAVSISWENGLTQISGEIYIDQSGSVGVGMVTQVTNLVTNNILYKIDGSVGGPGFISFDYNNIAISGAPLLSGTDASNWSILIPNSSGTIDFYNSSTNVFAALGANNLTTAQALALVTNNGTNSVWLQGTTPNPTFATAGSYNSACGDNLNPNCYGSLTGNGAYNWTTNNTGFDFVNPMSYTLSANNLDDSTPGSTAAVTGYRRWTGISGDNVTGRGGVQVPEPELLTLLGIGLLGMVFSRRKKA